MMENEELKCKLCNKCENSCPAGIKPNKMIGYYKTHNYIALAKSMYDENPFALTCGSICHAPCINSCIFNKVNKPINIKEIQAICARDFYDWLPEIELSHNIKKEKCAVIGTGISGLTAAWYLAKNNYLVSLYEKSNSVGGEINLIPNTRLPKIDFETDLNLILKHPLIDLNLEIEFTEDLEKEFDYIFYCCGCKPKVLDIKNKELVITYDKYLLEEAKNENIAIIGGGNVALECALYNKGKSTVFIRRDYWDMRIKDESFNKLRQQKVNILSNFIPTHCLRETNNKLSLCGNMYNNNVKISNFDKIIFAIGKEQIVPKTKKGIIIQPSPTVVETIGNTKKQIKNALHL